RHGRLLERVPERSVEPAHDAVAPDERAPHRHGWLRFTASITASRCASGTSSGSTHPGATMSPRPPVWRRASPTSSAMAAAGPRRSVPASPSPPTTAPAKRRWASPSAGGVRRSCQLRACTGSAASRSKAISRPWAWSITRGVAPANGQPERLELTPERARAGVELAHARPVPGLRHRVLRALLGAVRRPRVGDLAAPVLHAVHAARHELDQVEVEAAVEREHRV